MGCPGITRPLTRFLVVRFLSGPSLMVRTNIRTSLWEATMRRDLFHQLARLLVAVNLRELDTADLVLIVGILGSLERSRGESGVQM